MAKESRVVGWNNETTWYLSEKITLREQKPIGSGWAIFE